MLRELDLKLIKAEENGFFPLKPVNFAIGKVLRKYYAHEITERWYDSMAPECERCEDCQCEKCEVWERYRGSEEQLSYANWIDAWGAGIWGMTQQEVDDFAKELLTKHITKDKGHKERLFYSTTSDPNQLIIFYYNRDRQGSDYWFIFQKKGTNIDDRN